MPVKTAQPPTEKFLRRGLLEPLLNIVLSLSLDDVPNHRAIFRYDVNMVYIVTLIF